MRSRRRAVAVLTTFGLVASGIGASSLAGFTDSESTPQNSFTAGTLDLTASPRQQAWTVDNMAPGDVEYRVINIGSAGTLPLEYDATATLDEQADGKAVTKAPSPANDSLGEALKLSYRGTVPDAASCSADGAPELSSLASFVPGTAQKIDFGNPKRTLAAGAAELLCLSFELPREADNRYQADSARFTLTFNGQQTQRGATTDAPANTVGTIAVTPSVGDGLIHLNWAAAPRVTSGYTVTVTPATGVTGATTRTVTGTSMDFTGLTNGAKYRFIVRGYNGTTMVAQGTSAVIAPKRTPIPPSAVQQLTATPLNGAVDLS